MDIVPTVLSIMNVPIPNHVDGSVIEEVFIEKPKIKGEASLSEKDLRVIRELRDRLLKLGKSPSSTRNVR